MNELNVFSSENYFFSIHSVPVVITSLVIIIFGLSIFFREKASFVGYLYLLYSIPLFLWFAGMSITFASVTPEIALYWATFTNISTLFIPATFYLLSVVILNEYSKYKSHVAVVWMMTLVLLLIINFSDSYIIGIENYYWGYYVSFGQASLFFVIFFSVVITNTLYMYWSVYKKSPEHSVVKKRSKLLLIGFVVGSVAAVDFLPAYGLEIYPAGFIFILILVVYTTYVVWHYNLVDITPEFASNMLLEEMSEAVIVIDSDNIIRLINNSTSQLFSVKKDELLNKNITTAIPYVDFSKIFNELNIKGEFNNTYVNFTCQNKKKNLKISSRKLWNNAKSYVGCLYVMHDVTLQYEAEQLLKNNNAKLEKLVDERTAELLKEKDIAEKASLAKSEFLSSMSHELRTPLNAILGFSQLLEMVEEDDTKKKNIREIINGGNHLLELINEVLDLAKIESGHVDLSIKEHSLNKILNNSLLIIKALAEKKAIQIDNKISSLRDINISVDEMRFKQVLLNILSNAIKYNTANGKVTIDCSPCDEKMFCLSITDTGKGFTIEQLSHLFEPFERFGAENSHVEGTGLGLVIAKDLNELMGGTITVESEFGKGSRFIIHVPLA